MKNKILIIVAVFTFSLSANAQLDLGKFFASGADDAEVFLTSYLSPYLKGFGASMTGGWYNTAKPHQLGGFDITATFNVAMVPTSDREFNVTDLNLSGLVLAPGENDMAPTVAGAKSEGPQLNYADLPNDIKAFDMPKGTNFPYVPSPMLQAGVGLIKDTEIMGRFMPTVSFGDNTINLWGIGVKHGLKQWIPVLEKVPVLHITVMGGYTKLKSNLNISVDATDIGGTNSNVILEDGSAAPMDVWDDQSFDLVSTSFTGNLLVSANLPVVCFYGGIGFASSKTSLVTNGYYPMLSGFSNNELETTALLNPIDIEVTNKSGSKTKPRLNVGMRIKLGILTIHGDYTYTNYSMVSTGLGFSFR